VPSGQPGTAIIQLMTDNEQQPMEWTWAVHAVGNAIFAALKS